MAKYTPPFVEVGMFVHWFGTVDDTVPIALLVQEVGHDSVGGLLFSPNSSGRYVSAVHHADDPQMEKAEWIRKPGCWRHLKSNDQIIGLVNDMQGQTV